jgi:hypothetical protein
MATFSKGRFGEFRLIRWGLAGMRGDSNPNPIGPGILAGVTIWPSLICIVIGLFKASSRGKRTG